MWSKPKTTTNLTFTLPSTMDKCFSGANDDNAVTTSQKSKTTFNQSFCSVAAKAMH